MCGRYALYANLPRIFDIMEVLEHIEVELEPRYNIAPSQRAPVIRLTRGAGRRLDLLRWGLVPHWSAGPDTRYSMINARAESLADKPAYREAFRRRRCLVPATGFYEWQRRDGHKQPWLVAREDGDPMAFAGLWERWTDPDGQVLESFAIVTTAANPLVAPIHARMPVILPPAAHGAWLEPREQTPAALQDLLVPYVGGNLVAVPVSPRVNSPRHDVPECVAPLSGPEERL